MIIICHRSHASGFADHYVLGLRIDAARAEGNIPFYAVPYVKLRGIPSLRYQGRAAGAVEIELRRRPGDRWAVAVFTGAGAVDAEQGNTEADDDIESCVYCRFIVRSYNDLKSMSLSGRPMALFENGPTVSGRPTNSPCRFSSQE